MALQTQHRLVPKQVEVSDSFLRLSGTHSQAQQYFELYTHRLQQLKPVLTEAVHKKWGDSVLIHHRLLDSHESHSTKDSVIIGTLYKEMKNKPSPLTNLAEDKAVHASAPDNVCLVSDDDTLTMEDEYGSVEINGECIVVDKLYTGVVMAIRGGLDSESGIFMAKDFLLAGLPPQKSLLSSLEGSDTHRYVALLSGLHLARPTVDHLPTQMLFDFLSGYLSCDGDSDGDSINSGQICRVIIAGNALGEELLSKNDELEFGTDIDKRRKIAEESLSTSLLELDGWIAQLAASVAVDIMPGDSDPASTLLPQQPFHKCLFPISTTFNTFERRTNPFNAVIDGVKFLGTSGQNIKDMKTYGRCSDMESLELTLTTRNMAPTAPDTLRCYPYRQSDPFLIDECPHIYFAANCHQFSHKSIKGDNGERVTLVCVPDFGKTGQIVLVDLTTLDCNVMQFGVDMM